MLREFEDQENLLSEMDEQVDTYRDAERNEGKGGELSKKKKEEEKDGDKGKDKGKDADKKKETEKKKEKSKK